MGLLALLLPVPLLGRRLELLIERLLELEGRFVLIGQAGAVAALAVGIPTVGAPAVGVARAHWATAVVTPRPLAMLMVLTSPPPRR